MSHLVIPEPTENLKKLARRHYVVFKALHQHVWDTLGDYEEPCVQGPSYSKAGSHAKDLVDSYIDEESGDIYALASWLRYNEWIHAIRDMVCMVADQRRCQDNQWTPAAKAPAPEDGTLRTDVVTRLRGLFVQAGEDYHFAFFEAADYESLESQDRGYIDEFVADTQKDFAKELSGILSGLVAPRQRQIEILRMHAVDAARAISAKKQADEKKRKRALKPVSLTTRRRLRRMEALQEVLFKQSTWEDDDMQEEELDDPALGDASFQTSQSVVSPDTLDFSGDNRERMFYRTLDIAADMKGKPYEAFIDTHGREALFVLLTRCVNVGVWVDILGAGRTADQEYLQGLHETPDSPLPGWYLGIGDDTEDPTFFKKYVGQSSDSVRSRVHRHRNLAHALQDFLATGGTLEVFPRRREAVLFYQIWAAKATRNFKFVCLGNDVSDFDKAGKQVWFNIVEMFMSLMFQSLQPGTLRKYLGADALETPDCGLNIALPLYQGFRNDAVCATIPCLKSSDP